MYFPRLCKIVAGCLCVLILIFSVMTYLSRTSDFHFESMTLENGMQVVLVPNHKVPAVSHMLWYRVGAMDEEEGKTGIAHLFEHLMFKATEHMASGEFSSRVAKAGGNDNAFTHYDYTGYYQNIARDKLPMVMAMEADRMQHLLLTEEELAREKLVVMEERRSRIENNPMALLSESVDQSLFPRHPYGRPVIGWESDIMSVTVDEAKAFYQRYYAPNNAILVVVGDITMDSLSSLAKEHYGLLKPSVIPPRNIQRNTELPKATKVIREDDRVQKPQWIRSYVAPQQLGDCKECYATTMLSYLLGEAQTSLLYKTLVVDKKIATSVGSYYNDMVLGPATFSISATPALGVTIDELEKEIEILLAHTQSTPFTEEELTRAKNMMAAQVIYAQEDFSSLARIFGNVYALGLDGSYIQNWEANIREVSTADIQQAAKALFDREHAITGWLLPKNKNEVTQ